MLNDITKLLLFCTRLHIWGNILCDSDIRGFYIHIYFWFCFIILNFRCKNTYELTENVAKLREQERKSETEHGKITSAKKEILSTWQLCYLYLLQIKIADWLNSLSRFVFVRWFCVVFVAVSISKGKEGALCNTIEAETERMNYGGIIWFIDRLSSDMTFSLAW